MRFRVRDCYPLWCGFPSASANTRLCNFPTRRQTDQDRPYNPRDDNDCRLSHRTGLGSSLFARHYSGSRGFFPFLRVLRCFSSPACLYLPYVFRQEYARITTRGFPHSEIPGSKVGQHLPRAYRSRPRPSSALGAKASTVCPYSLDRKEHVILSLWSFQGARGPKRPYQTRPSRAEGAVSQNSTACVHVEVDVILGEPGSPDGHRERAINEPERLPE